MAALFILCGTAQAEDKRMAYVVQHGNAKDLAGILTRHFKEDADIQVLPDSPSNCLLIRANPTIFAEVVKLLEQIDRRPQLVAVELLIAEVKAKRGKDDKTDGKELDAKEFTGPAQEVRDKLETLKKNGRLDGLKRIQLTAATDQPATLLLGETVPTIRGVTRTATGFVSKSVFYQNTGTNAKITVRAAAENSVTLEIDLSDARVRIPEDGIEIGKDESGGSIRLAEVAHAKLQTRLTVRPDQAVAAEGVKTESKSGEAQTLIVVSARLLPAAKGSK
jgi:type II secretory pathway component GspD/PulD (secretin)